MAIVRVTRFSNWLLAILAILTFLVALGTLYSSYSTYETPGVTLPASAGVASPLRDTDHAWSILHPEEHAFREPRTIKLSWTVTLGLRSPDGVSRPVFLINDQFPGPTIEARSGDELIVEVVNALDDDEGFSIHWHGLSMRGANEMDGVVGLTQCSIAKSQKFTYQFRIDEDQAGTFWYHGHSGTQRADGLYGGLVVHKPAANQLGEVQSYQYDAEQLFLIGDWYHRRGSDVLAWYEDFGHFGAEAAPDSLLINGHGFFDCAMAVKARPVDCEAVERPWVQIEGSRTRLRIVNTGALSGFSLTIPDANMTVIQADGGNQVDVAAGASSIGVLYPGERVDVVIEQTEQMANGESSLAVSLDREHLKFKNFALTSEQHFLVKWNEEASVSSGAVEPLAYFDLSTALGSAAQIPASPSHKAVLYANMEIRASHGEIPLGVMNHTSWVSDEPEAKPLLALDRALWDESGAGKLQVHVPWFKESGQDQWIELAINNVDDKGHPFHLHGYSFYVVSRQASTDGLAKTYNPFEANGLPGGEEINAINPLRKDTVYVPRAGYVVLRFPLDNDGLWLLHCHALWHQAVGLAIPLQIGAEVDEASRTNAAALCSA